jgi:hypothetical protein
MKTSEGVLGDLQPTAMRSTGMFKPQIPDITIHRRIHLSQPIQTKGPGRYPGLFCGGESWFWISGGGTVKIEFTHAQGDLDLFAYDGARRQVSVSQSTSNSEQVIVPSGGYARVIGYDGATNRYCLIIQSL